MAYGEADLVFSGKVTNISLDGNYYIVTLQIIDMWKGEINYLGTAKEANITGYGSEENFYEISPSTKIISHSAQIAPGSSGGPLFDKNGYLIGLNTFMDSSFNYSVSADHIKELLKK